MKNILLLEKEKQQDIENYMPRDMDIRKMVNFFSMFSDVTRMKILTALCLSDMCVNDIAVLLNLNQTTVSHQLKYLRQCGVVSCNRQGKIISYSISDNSVNDMLLNGVDYLITTAQAQRV